MITSEQAENIRARSTRLQAWIKTIRNKRTGWASYKPEDKPANIPNVTNEETSALEVFDFCANPPEKYFLYINEHQKTATTWTGELLGHVTFGHEFRSPAFGGWPSVRVPVTIHAINNATYHGIYYKSSGNYARVKMSAGCRKVRAAELAS